MSRTRAKNLQGKSFHSAAVLVTSSPDNSYPRTAPSEMSKLSIKLYFQSEMILFNNILILYNNEILLEY